MSAAVIWIVLGIVLILSELLATSVVAVFIGIGAIVTGILLQLGVIEATAWQFIVFGLVSILTLVLARKRLKQWFGGTTADKSQGQRQFQQDLGERVVVQEDFQQGAGRVVLNGVSWNALSDEDLKQGDVAWVVSNEGIRLTVSSERPE